MNNFRQNTNFSRTVIMNLLGKVREALLKKDEKGINFDSTFSDIDVKNMTGVNRAAFENLLTYLSAIRDTQVRSARRTCLGIYLTKLKTGLSNKILVTLFQVSRDSIRRAIKSVRKNLLQTFTPHHIGFEHITREDLIRNHTRPLAQTLFGQGLNPAILVLDGTYIYIQKSSVSVPATFLRFAQTPASDQDDGSVYVWPSALGENVFSKPFNTFSLFIHYRMTIV